METCDYSITDIVISRVYRYDRTRGEMRRRSKVYKQKTQSTDKTKRNGISPEEDEAEYYKCMNEDPTNSE